MTLPARSQPQSVQQQAQVRRLLLSPKAQLALRFLELPVEELALELQGLIAQNPLFSPEAEGTSEEEEDLSLEELMSETQELPSSYEPPVEEELNFDDNHLTPLRQLDAPFLDYFEDVDTPSGRPQSGGDQLDQNWEEALAEPQTLIHFLLYQTRETFEPHDWPAAEVIIGCLDDTGFLTLPLGEVAKLAQTSEETCRRLLADLQTFTPLGIATYDPQEAVLLQLWEANRVTSLAYQIAEHHWEALLDHNFPSIASKLGLKVEQVVEIVTQELHPLNVRPAVWHEQEATPYITPDLVVSESEGVWRIEVNEEPLPSLRLNPTYLRLLQKRTTPKETKAYLEQQLEAARWIILSVEQRQRTLRLLGHVLLRQQRDYLTNDEGTLKPLNLHDIAWQLNLHESTASRLVDRKAMLCGRGTLPLRALFVAPRPSASPAHAILELLADWLEQEPPAAPHSDAQLAEMLAERNLSCSRRQVARYRSQLGYGNLSQRRSLK